MYKALVEFNTKEPVVFVKLYIAKLKQYEQVIISDSGAISRKYNQELPWLYDYSVIPSFAFTIIMEK